MLYVILTMDSALGCFEGALLKLKSKSGHKLLFYLPINTIYS